MRRGGRRENRDILQDDLRYAMKKMQDVLDVGMKYEVSAVFFAFCKCQTD